MPCLINNMLTNHRKQMHYKVTALTNNTLHAVRNTNVINRYAKLNPCHIRVASLQRSHNVKKLQIAEVRAVQTQATLWNRCGNAVETLCNRLERHAAAFILIMLRTNAAAWHLHSVIDSTLWQRCGIF